MSRRPNRGGQLLQPIGSGGGPVAIAGSLGEISMGRAERRRSEKLTRQALKSASVRILKDKAA